MRKTITIALLALCAAIAVPNLAQAQVVTPSLCNTPREIAQFLLGVRKGRSLARQAIASLGTVPDLCDDLEAIQELQDAATDITDAIPIPPDAPETAQCHARGQFAGLLAELVELQELCGTTCITDGEFIGEVSAQLYCALSIALDGLGLAELFDRLATNACGELFQDACDITFLDVATDDPLCLEYTLAPFEDVFDVAQNNQCAANPDVP